MAILVEGRLAGAEPGELAGFENKAGVAGGAEREGVAVAQFGDVRDHLPRLGPQEPGLDPLEPEAKGEEEERIAGEHDADRETGGVAAEKDDVDERGDDDDFGKRAMGELPRVIGDAEGAAEKGEQDEQADGPSGDRAPAHGPGGIGGERIEPDERVATVQHERGVHHQQQCSQQPHLAVEELQRVLPEDTRDGVNLRDQGEFEDQDRERGIPAGDAELGGERAACVAAGPYATNYQRQYDEVEIQPQP